MGYITGGNDATYFMYNMPNGIELKQLLAIVTKYFKAHPESWNDSAFMLVIEALKEAFPKKDEK